MLGAAVGPYHHVGVNCEGVYNFECAGEVCTVAETCVAYIDPSTQQYVVEQLPITQAGICTTQANLLTCAGEPGPVIQVQCAGRTGDADIVTCLRHTLRDHYRSGMVALGGVLALERGAARHTIMSDFTDEPLDTPEKVDYYFTHIYLYVLFILICWNNWYSFLKSSREFVVHFANMGKLRYQRKC